MAIIYQNELYQANGSQMLSNITDIIDDSNQLKDKISSFLQDLNKNMSGDIFTYVNAKFSLYLDALKKQVRIYDNLKNNIKSANYEMINYMGDIVKLDDGEKEEIGELINNIYSNIRYLETDVKNDITVKKDINELYVIYNEMKKYYDKINGLAAADSSAFAKISDVLTDIANFTFAMNKVQVGLNNVFYNLGNRNILYYAQIGHYDEEGRLIAWQSDWNKDIRESGCGPTSYAMVIGTMLQDPGITPETIANMMAHNNWSNIGGNFIDRLSEDFNVNCTHGRYDANAIEAVVLNGGGFIGAAKKGGHYIAVTDVVYKNDTRYFVLCDPWPEFNNNMMEPTLITEEELRAEEISMDFYITPSNITIETTPIEQKIISIQNNNTNQIIYRVGEAVPV